MTKLPDTSHPIWSIIRLLIVMSALTITLHYNASHFDQTEINSLTTMAMVLAVSEGASQILTKLRSTDASSKPNE